MATVPGARIREAGPGSPSRALSWRISSDNQGGRQWAGSVPLNLFPVLSSRNSFNNLLNAYCVPAVISGSGGTCPCSPDSLSGSIVCVSVCRGRGEVFLVSSPPSFKGASLVAETVKICLPMQESWVPSLGQEDPLEKEMAAHSSILAWRIPWTEEPVALQSMGLQRVGHD